MTGFFLIETPVKQTIRLLGHVLRMSAGSSADSISRPVITPDEFAAATIG